MKKLLLLSAFLLANDSAHAQAILGWTGGLPSISTNNHTIAPDSQGNVYTIGIHSSNYDFDPGSGVFNLQCFGSNMHIMKVNALGNFVWAKQVAGGTTTTYAGATATAITIDAADNIYVSGTSRKLGAGAILDFDPGVGVVDVSNPAGQYVMYILKLNANGDYVWNAQFDNTNVMAADSQNTVQAMKVDAAGNLYATGGFFGTIDFDPRTGINNITSTVPNNNLSSDIFVIKIDAIGSLVWAKAMLKNGANNSYNTNKGTAIELDSFGNIYTTGIFTESIDADPNSGVNNLLAFTTALSAIPVMLGTNAQYVSKLDNSGNLVWAHSIAGDHGVGSTCSLVVDNSNNIIISGNSTKLFTGNTNVASIRDLDFGSGTYYLPNDTDCFLLKINSNAGFVWAKSTARAIVSPLGSDNSVLGLATDGSGNVYTTGSFGTSGTTDFDPNVANFNLTSAGATDGYLSKLDTNGNFVFANKFGGTGNEKGYSIAISPLGKILVAGSSDTGFAKSVTAVASGGSLASYTQPALATTQFEFDKYISIYPNPTSGEFNIRINEDLIGSKVSIFNMLGQIITSFNLDQLTNNQNLDFGMYILEIEKDNDKISKKLIIQ